MKSNEGPASKKIVTELESIADQVREPGRMGEGEWRRTERRGVELGDEEGERSVREGRRQ
eukprot:759451-Hanusia_phi.AAC.11